MIANYLIKYLFIFAFCATSGYLLEVVYRSITNHKLVNPGFLNGICLPIYGCGGVVLFLICSLLDVINSNIVQIIMIFLVGMLVMTLIELISGLYILKKYHMMLWDYTNNIFNYKGLICIKFSILWGIISIFYFYFIFPNIIKLSNSIIYMNISILLLGIYYGVFFCDLYQSMHLAENIKQFAKEISETIRFEKLKDLAKDYLLAKKSNKLLDYLPINYMKDYLSEKRIQTSLKIAKAKNKMEDIKEDYETFKETLKEMIENEKHKYTK